MKDLMEMVKRINAERVAAGLCRHCGGAVPCWSGFGDKAVGVRHDSRSIKRRLRAETARDLKS